LKTAETGKIHDRRKANDRVANIQIAITMKLYITGIAGFLGCHLAEELLKKGHEVSGCDNLINGDSNNVPKEAIFKRADCLDLDTMTRSIHGCDVVYHCAALPYEGLSVFSPFLISQNIYSGSISVMTAAIRSKVRRFVFMSSMARYGMNEVPFTEEMTPKPQDPYGISKYAAERALVNLCEAHRMEYVIAIPHNIYGPRQKFDDPYHNVVAIMINLMLQGRQPIIYGDGNQKRCFSYVGDIVNILGRLGFEGKASGETFNVGPDDEFISMNELARNIADLLNFDLNPIYLKPRPMEVKLANCSASKTRRFFGFKNRTSLREGLRQMIEYVKDAGPRPFSYNLPIEIRDRTCPRSWTDRLF
jgi:UDP-glucose 4-epimerase